MISSSATLPDSVDRLIDRFEADWRSGSILPLRQWIEIHVRSSRRSALIRELILVDMEYRWRGFRHPCDHLGQCPKAHAYLEILPEVDSPEHRIFLLAEEYRIRKIWGDHPMREAFLAEYPNDPSNLARTLGSIEDELNRDVVPSTESASESNERLDPSDYRLEKMLGAGGMGKVYRAWWKSGHRHVAVKALAKARHASPSVIQQFTQEAVILTKLRHPNLVESYGQGRFPSGGRFLVMELIRGSNLQDQIERAPVPLEAAWRIVRDVANVLEFVHQRGVIHCDLKPSNVLIDDAGQVKVTDFGLAQLIGRNASSDRGVIGGTPGFTAPEVWSGQRDKIGPPADIYSLAAFFWALITGKPPKHHDRSTRIESADLISRRLQDGFAHCLAESSENRSQTIHQALRRLQP